jgi:fumarylacetoacetase
MSQLDETHDASRTSWVESAKRPGCDFPLQNLPFGRVLSEDGEARPCVAIGDQLLDLGHLVARISLPDDAREALDEDFASLGAAERTALRRALSHLLGGEVGQPIRQKIAPLLTPIAAADLLLPVAMPNYTDFYSSVHHATNVGALFRPDNPLLPNYKHVPIGYHGRASTLVPSGAEIRRPRGQTKPADADLPVFGPSRRLDYECEFGIVIGPGNTMGEPIPIDEASDHIAGFCLVNDWSARDIQAWEYQPLGPFLAKNFATSVSPWLVTPEALAPFRRAPLPRPDGDPHPLPYLQARDAWTLDLIVQVTLSSAAMRDKGLAPQVLSRSGFSEATYWTPAQLVTHHASNGCALEAGDLLATGTLSGPDPSSWGSMLELSRGGKQPIALDSGETRTFLQDGDEVTLSARCEAPGRVGIGFGACAGLIVAA